MKKSLRLRSRETTSLLALVLATCTPPLWCRSAAASPQSDEGREHVAEAPNAEAANTGAATAASEGGSAARNIERILVTVAHPEVFKPHRPGTTPKPYGRGYRTSLRTARIARQLAREYGLIRLDVWPIPSIQVDCIVFRLEAGRAAEALERLAVDPRVESVQPMQLFETLGGAPATSAREGEARRGSVTSADPYRGMQHALSELEVEKVHGLTQGQGVRVALIDTGVDLGHPDLKGRVKAHRDFTASAGRSTDDIHGTAMAGVIASVAENGIGISGVAPRVELLALKACRPVSEDAEKALCDSFTLALAIDFALEHGADVLNLSLAGPDDPLLGRILGAAVGRGVIVVAAAPRTPTGANRFPSSLSSILSVAVSTDGKDGNYGALLEAPGLDVLTTVPGGEYDFMSGSSLAAAHVSGVVALLLEIDPTLRGAQLRQLLGSGDPEASPAMEGLGPRRGEGARQAARVNACHAVATLVGSMGCGGSVLKSSGDAPRVRLPVKASTSN